MTKRLRRNTAFALTPVAAFGLWLSAQAQDRIDAITAGPSQVTVSYTAPASTKNTPDAAWSPEPVSLLEPGSPFDPDLRVVAWGDISNAAAIAVLVPGVGHDTEEFDHDSGTTPARPQTLPARARALYQAAADPTLAVIAWLGYQPPATIPDAVTAVPIRTGAANLAALGEFVQQVNPSARTTWICHSYGSLICAAALHQSSQTEPDGGAKAGHQAQLASPAALALIGSPGVQADSVEDLPTSAEVWAGRGDSDFIELVNLLQSVGGGFGTDPASPKFGARPIPCDPHTTHSDYFRPHSTQLAALAQIVKGTNNV